MVALTKKGLSPMMISLHGVDPSEPLRLPEAFDTILPPGLTTTQAANDDMRSRNAYLQSEIVRLTEENVRLERTRQEIAAQRLQELRLHAQNAHLRSEISSYLQKASTCPQAYQVPKATISSPMMSELLPGLMQDESTGSRAQPPGILAAAVSCKSWDPSEGSTAESLDSDGSQVGFSADEACTSEDDIDGAAVFYNVGIPQRQLAPRVCA